MPPSSARRTGSPTSTMCVLGSGELPRGRAEELLGASAESRSLIAQAVKEFSKARLKRQAAQAASKGSRARGPRGRPPPRAETVEEPDEAGPQNLSLVRASVTSTCRLSARTDSRLQGRRWLS